MPEEAFPQGFDGFLDPGPQLVESANTLFLGRLGPLLQKTRFRPFSFKARLMDSKPKKNKVGVGFAFHHGFEVKLHVGIAGEASVIAK
ncbi:MAG: hypothetical protein U0V70_10920 [Terriglobia bacterium]